MTNLPSYDVIYHLKSQTLMMMSMRWFCSVTLQCCDWLKYCCTRGWSYI